MQKGNAFLTRVIPEKKAAVEVRLMDEEKAITVRLVGTNVSHVGQVEIQYNAAWGAVCDNWWDIRDAHVFCRMLGYKGAEGPIMYIEGETTTRNLMNFVGCSGKEKSIAECAHWGWWKAHCSYKRLAGVVCKVNEDPPPVQVRLAGGRSPNSGRVEVRYHGVWGTACDDEWDTNDAGVVCRMLGYTGVQKYRTSDFNSTNGFVAAAPQFTVSISSDKRLCTATLRIIDHAARNAKENKLIKFYEILTNKVGNSSSWVLEIDGIRSFTIGDGKYYNGSYNVPLEPGTTYNVSVRAVTKAQNGVKRRPRDLENFMPFAFEHLLRSGQEKKAAVDVILMDGKTTHDGRVEVRTNNGQWSTICNYQWDLRDAYVVCHMLNYSKAVSADTANVKGSGPIYPKWLDCYGHETSIEQCSQGSVSCDHSQDAAVVCGNSLTLEEKAITVRLVGTNVSHVGQVEIEYNGTWGAVCLYNWDIEDAHVICRMLGYKTSERPIWYIEGETTTKKLMDRVDADPPPVQVRLAGGRSPNSGRVEVRYHGAWGTVCNGGWDANDAEVVCRMLGYTGVQKFITTEFSPVKGITWFSYLRCTGTEMSITNCSHRGWGNPGCLHSSDIGVACKMATAPQFTVSSSSDKRSCTAMLSIIDHAKRNTKEKELITNHASRDEKQQGQFHPVVFKFIDRFTYHYHYHLYFFGGGFAHGPVVLDGKLGITFGGNRAIAAGTKHCGDQHPFAVGWTFGYNYKDKFHRRTGGPSWSSRNNLTMAISDKYRTKSYTCGRYYAYGFGNRHSCVVFFSQFSLPFENGLREHQNNVVLNDAKKLEF
ncbi:hypothetical protein QZH41_007849 [Actinostola sp. cb2023]|nr:hypothetical protein QZH41_007849 [Actinostola sp. cb2023]